VLTSGIGEKPYGILKKAGLAHYEVSGFIETALEAVYGNGDSLVLKGRRKGCSAGGCAGSGGGCL